MTDDDTTDASTFWDVAAPLLADGSLHESTIMNGACVRDGAGEFVAMPHHKGPGMVVKLPANRVTELIEDGVGQPFAPAQKVFREWVLLEQTDEQQWTSLLRESITFVGR